MPEPEGRQGFLAEVFGGNGRPYFRRHEAEVGRIFAENGPWCGGNAEKRPEKCRRPLIKEPETTRPKLRAAEKKLRAAEFKFRAAENFFRAAEFFLQASKIILPAC